MTTLSSRAVAGALAGAAAVLWLSPAFAHAVCGDRIFPATLAIDDPGVGDELALPTLTYLPQNSGGSQEFDATFSYTKTIFPGFGLSVQDGPTWQRPGGYGWGDLNTEAKYNFLCIPEFEFMASVGLDGHLGKHRHAGHRPSPSTVYQPVLDVGKGFGDLPKSLNILRPFAVTAELSESLPGQAWTDGNQNSTNLNWGFTVQYSLPYYNSHVGEIDNDFFKHLIPITEFAFSKPISNFAPGTNQTTGTIQPGAIYMADTWQFALEAIVPDEQRERPRGRRRRRVALLLRRHFPRHSRQTNLQVGSAMIRHSIIKIAASLAFAFAATAAYAHAQLEKATPSVGGTVASPAEIRLKFSEGVEPRFSRHRAGFGGRRGGAARPAQRRSRRQQRADRQGRQDAAAGRLHRDLARRVGRHP